VDQCGQATVEYLGLALLVLALLLGGAELAWGRRPTAPAGDRAYLAMAARFTPRIAIEHGDDTELPVDFRRCRQVRCSEGAGVRPVLYLHAVHRPGFLYLEYWEYEPDSTFAHTGIGLIDGFHDDDWEGVIVKLRANGDVVGARATAHLGFNGRHPWWDLAADDWAPYPEIVYRAAGSHAGSFSPSGIDLAGDGWNGTAAIVRPSLLPADAAAGSRAVFDPGAVAPWDKDAWDDPETVVTGHPGDHAAYARYARWWALACLPCGHLGISL
jgi:hypothetical protein